MAVMDDPFASLGGGDEDDPFSAIGPPAAAPKKEAPPDLPYFRQRREMEAQAAAAASPTSGLGPKVAPQPGAAELEAQRPPGKPSEVGRPGDTMLTLPAQMAGDVFEGVSKAVEKVPGAPTAMALLQLPSAIVAAGVAGVVDPDAWWQAYRESEQYMLQRHGKQALDWTQMIRSMPGVGTVLRKAYLDDLQTDEHWGVRLGTTALQLGLDIVTDPLILLKGGGPVGAELVRYAATGKTAVKSLEAIPRARAAVMGAERLIGSPLAGIIYGPEVLESTARAIERGDLPAAVGASLVGGLMVHGVREDFRARFGRAPTDAEAATVLQELAQRVQEERAAMVPEVWEGPPPPEGAELGTRAGAPGMPIPETLRSDAEVRVDVMRSQGLPNVWGTPEPAKAPLVEKTAPYSAVADNALREAVQAAERAILDAPEKPPEVDAFTSPGVSQAALSPEELARAARKETYYRVNRDGTLTYQGHQPDPIGSLRPGEGVVKVLPGLDPMVTQASGPDSKILERFTAAAKKAPELLGVPERSVAETPGGPPKIEPGSAATVMDKLTRHGMKDFPGFVEVTDPRTGRKSYRRPDYNPPDLPPPPGTEAAPETLGQRLAREQGLEGPPKRGVLEPPGEKPIDLEMELLAEGPPEPPGKPAGRATGGVPTPSPAAPPRSVGHVAFAGDVKGGMVEFFTVKVGDEAHIYSSPADAPLTPAGMRKPKDWVGLADDDTRARIAAMQRLAKRKIDRRGRLNAGIDPAEVIADIIDHHRKKRAEDRVKMNAAVGRAGAPIDPSTPAAPPAGGPPPPPSPAGPPPPPGSAPRPSAPPAPEGLPKYAGSINLWQRIDHGEDVLDLFQETYKQHQPIVDEARRGTMTLAQIRQAASNLGTTDDAVARALTKKPGTALNAERLWAINEGLKETSKATIEHAKLFLTTPEISRTPEMEAELVAQLARHTAVFASVSGANSEAGRALGILNRLRTAGEDARKLQDVIQNYGRTRGVQRETLSEIATLLSRVDPNDVRALGKFVRQVTKPTLSSKVYEYWINAILSGPPTHVSNALSGVLGAALMPVELGLAATGNQLLIGAAKLIPSDVRAKLLPQEVTQARYFGEMFVAGKQLLGALDLPLQVAEKLGLAKKLGPEDGDNVAWNRGFREATAAALQAWRTEMPVVGEVNKAYESGQIPGAIPGKTGRVVRAFGTRPLLAMDQFFEALIYRMSLNARAYRQAAKEGHATRLGIADRMAELLENPSAILKNEAVDEAVYRTFNTPLEGFSRSMDELRRKHPLLYLVAPFIRTPVNIVAFGLERTPGANFIPFGRAVREYAAGRLDIGKLSDQSAKVMLGLGLGVGIAELVGSGVVTGGGPKDPAERRTLEASGWKPYSVRIGDSYYQYSRLEPLGVTLGIISDYLYARQVGENDVDKLPGQVMYALTRNIFDKSWVSGLTGLFKTIMDWERYGEGYALRTATSLLPNFLAYAERATDTERTIPQNLLQATASKVPGVGKLMEALGGEDPTEYARALDIWGRSEVLEDTWFERFASPFRRSPVRTDLVTPHLIRLGIALNPPSKTIQDWKDPTTGKDLPQPQGLDAVVLAQARGYARYALASMIVSRQDFLLNPNLDEQRDYIHRQLAKGSTIVTRRAKALLYAGQPLTMKDLVGDLMEWGPPPLE